MSSQPPGGACAEVDLSDPQLLVDPYPVYQRWRAVGPVIRNEAMGWWMVTDHAEVGEVFRTPSVYSSAATAEFGAAGEAMAANTMASADPPDHTRLRGMANRVFTPRAVAQLEATMHEIIDEALAGRGPGDLLDVTNDLAYPLASNVIAQLLGVPRTDRDLFRSYADAISLATDPRMTPPDVLATAREGIVGLHTYLADQIAHRRTHPTDEDLIGRLVAANEGDELSDEELIATCTMLLIAGYEASVALIGLGALTLVEHPDQRQRLLEAPGLMDSAVEELLRFVGPVQVSLRVATRDVELAGTPISVGDIVMPLPGCAGRDPKRYEEPEVFDVGRNPHDHFAFGFGIHVCLGAPLARLETKVALSRLLAAAPAYTRAEAPPSFHPTIVARRLTTMPVTL